MWPDSWGPLERLASNPDSSSGLCNLHIPFHFPDCFRFVSFLYFIHFPSIFSFPCSSLPSPHPSPHCSCSSSFFFMGFPLSYTFPCSYNENNNQKELLYRLEVMDVKYSVQYLLACARGVLWSYTHGGPWVGCSALSLNTSSSALLCQGIATFSLPGLPATFPLPR